MQEYVTLRELADEFGLDRSNARKYVLKLGFTPVRVRTQDSNNQLTLAFTIEDAEAIREIRGSQGYGSSNKPVDNGKGYFYIIQVIPEFAPNRVKLGYAHDTLTRLKAHQTAAPTAILVHSWPCRESWEQVAIASITRSGCKLIANEVFECDGSEALVQRGGEFFAIMPSL